MIKTFTKSRIYHGFTQWMLDSRHWFIKIHPFSVISSWWLCLGFGWPNCLVSAAFEPKNARCLYTLRESNMATGNSRTGEALIGKSSVKRRCSIAAFDYQRVCDYIYIYTYDYICMYIYIYSIYYYIYIYVEYSYLWYTHLHRHNSHHRHQRHSYAYIVPALIQSGCSHPCCRSIPAADMAPAPPVPPSSWSKFWR